MIAEILHIGPTELGRLSWREFNQAVSYVKAVQKKYEDEARQASKVRAKHR